MENLNKKIDIILNGKIDFQNYYFIQLKIERQLYDKLNIQLYRNLRSQLYWEVKIELENLVKPLMEHEKFE